MRLFGIQSYPKLKKPSLNFLFLVVVLYTRQEIGDGRVAVFRLI